MTEHMTGIVWPNGAEGGLTGMDTETDAEKVRAHAANCCIAEGTPVVTERGDVPIEAVRVGDLVATRQGWRRVSAVHDQGVRSTWRIETESGRSVELTDDHKVWTDRGWLDTRTVGQSTKRREAVGYWRHGPD